MFQTDLGQFDGDSWEAFCQKCFKMRYGKEGYQAIDAHFGCDLGIEGFTRSGKAFQCYCPDENYNPGELYEHQRKKITTDLGKLKLRQTEMIQYLDGVEIKEWIFVTPINLNKKLNLHCIKKRNEYRALQLPHLHEEFDVLVHDIDFYLEQALIVLKLTENLINIETEPVLEALLCEWREAKSDQVQNTLRKLKATFPDSPSRDFTPEVLKLTDRRIREYLEGTTVFNRLETVSPERFEALIRVISDIERDVEDRCSYPATDNKALYDSIVSLVDERLKSEFGDMFNSSTLSSVRRRIIADWLMRCPIDFL